MASASLPLFPSPDLCEDGYTGKSRDLERREQDEEETEVIILQYVGNLKSHPVGILGMQFYELVMRRTGDLIFVTWETILGTFDFKDMAFCVWREN